MTHFKFLSFAVQFGEKDYREAVERNKAVLALAAEMEAQLARADVWFDSIPAKIKEKEFEAALAKERLEKEKEQAEQRRRCVSFSWGSVGVET